MHRDDFGECPRMVNHRLSAKARRFTSDHVERMLSLIFENSLNIATLDLAISHCID
jgi:hypothetical protein